ncbi:hypothetical protein KC333_g9110 [Hortaea werneckii]|nr:hypothetical protein KC333_g9110 [Hortaea werneckii]KAI7308900.1 hypothetical protein KC326_g7275 [Hortaea werneckii]
MFSLTLSFTFSVDFSQPNKKTPAPKTPLSGPHPSPHTPPIIHPSNPLPNQRPSDNLSPPKPPYPEPLNPQARHPSPPPSPMPTNRPSQPSYLADDASFTSLSPAAQYLQHEIRAGLNQRRARANGESDDPTSFRILEVATRGSEKRSRDRWRRTMGKSAGFATTEESTGSSSGGGGRGDDDRGRSRRRVRSPKGFGSTTASTSTTTTTTSAGDTGTWTSEFSLVDAETVLRGGRGRDGRGVLEQQQVYSPLANCTSTVTPTTTGIAAGTEGNDKDDEDDDDEEEEGGWDFLTTPPPTSPSTTEPLLALTRDGDKSPESFTPFRRSGNPSPSSRSGIVSTSSSDQNRMTGLLQHHQKKEDEGEDNESPLPSASEQEKHQHRFPWGGQLIKTRNRRISNDPSSSSYSLPQHRRSQPQEQYQVMIDHHEENQYHSPPSRSKRFSRQATSKVPLAVHRRRDLLDEGILRERGNQGKNGTRSQGEMGLKGSSDGDGWGFVGRGGGELREQGDGGDDYGWEMI